MRNFPNTRGGKGRGGFTLVEVVIAIGVLAIALAVIVGSVAFSSGRGAENARKIQALTLAETAVTDLRGALNNPTRAKSGLLAIDRPANPPVAATKEIYFDAEGVKVDSKTGAFFAATLNYYPDAGVTSLVHVHTRLVWPAAAKVGSEQGSVELLNSFSLR
jgi:prepilin-type N-terminal cleavage/methylation domain-containing protein